MFQPFVSLFTDRKILRASLALLLLGLVSGCSWVGLLSVSTGGVQADDFTQRSCVSADGRFVGFQTKASTLVAGDIGGFEDIFVRDTSNLVTVRVSVDSTGTAGNGDSIDCAISDDGNHVSFSSAASNLVAGDTNNETDVFVHDRNSGVTSRVSVATGGAEGNGLSNSPAMSADANRIAFRSLATNLVTGDTLGQSDVFVRDRNAGTTTRVSVSSIGTEARDDSRSPAISADGQVVAFVSIATNLVANDNNNDDDIFVHELGAGTTFRVSIDSSGVEGNSDSALPALSADGDIVAFRSFATNLVTGDINGWGDVFVHDRTGGATTIVSVDSSGGQGVGTSDEPAISSSGRYVSFHTAAALVPLDPPATVDVFLHDRITGVTTMESLTAVGDQIVTLVSGLYPAFSADERYLSFTGGPGFVDSDTNNLTDIYLRAIPPISVSGMVPNLLPAGATTAVIISGANFLSGAIPAIRNYISGFTIVDENTITANVTVPASAPTGAENITVLRLGTGPGNAAGVAAICAGCATVF